MKTKYNIDVDPDKCIGAGSCIAMADLTFKLNEKGRAEVVNQNGNSDPEKLMAAQSCPVRAIAVFNLETGQRVWPK